MQDETMPAASEPRQGPGWITWVGLFVVAVAAAVLSFASLRHLAAICGTSERLAWLLPVAIDAAAVVATRVWLSRRVPAGARHQARRLAIGAIVLSVVGNAADHVLSAFRIVPPWYAVVAVGAVAPAVLGTVAHLVALVVAPEEDPQVTDPGEDLVARTRYLLASAEVSGETLGRGRLARELGVSEHEARQVLAKVRQVQGPTLSVNGASHV